MIRLRVAVLGIALAITTGFASAQNIPSPPVAPVPTAPGGPPVASPDRDKARAAKSARKPAAKKAAGKAKAQKKRSGKAAAQSRAPKN